ncbi:amidotransferase [Limnohabitans sp. Rim8]|jgi:GMP synthase-like glutamine amidotransferase|uniref:glutamine amidotransferase-related protein n=1 Tax=Limnohabitans sp. Rim8 TaxID=1100718 RepID=UPI0025D8D4F6|nr:amidotransferase [Limnohabitans sp. Rim8]
MHPPTQQPTAHMHLCILENDDLDPPLAQRYTRVASMFEDLFAQAGYQGRIDTFSARHGQYPARFAIYDAVLLTGSRADAFSDEPWVVALREQVARLLQDQHKLLGVCFGHQLIAHCLGAPVQRAPRGWRVGRQSYEWLGAPEHLGLVPAQAAQAAQVALLASHQDQVLALPPGATLLATQPDCPVAAYALGNQVFCIQPHPEFTPEVSAFLLDKRRALMGEPLYEQSMASLSEPHDGLALARFMVRFVQYGLSA